MCTSLNQLMRIALLLTAIDAALVLFPVTAHAGSGFRRAIDAGVAGAKKVAVLVNIDKTNQQMTALRAMRRLLGKAAPDVVRALPGDALAGEASVRRLPDFKSQWSDDPEEIVRRARWAAEYPKRFLAASLAVGTIDQALLGAVRVKHAQMRSFCLSRSLLVVDEVHASDVYMEKLLIALLDQHRAAGGHALLLSATLGATARSRLLLGERKAKKKTPSPADAVTLA